MNGVILQTREKFRLRIGEIIEATLGVNTVKAIFEAAENGDEDAKARIEQAKATGFAPSGMIALQLGVVDKETKEALLTAQAAERTLLSIEELERFYQVDVPMMKEQIKHDQSAGEFEDMMHSPHTETIEDYYKNNIQPVDTQNKSFKFISSLGDADFLNSAQAMHHLMTQYESNEKRGIKEELIAQYMRVPDAVPFGKTYIDGFKACVSNSYAQSAKLLASKGHVVLAEEMMQVVASIGFDQHQAKRHSPSRFGLALLWKQSDLVNDTNKILDPYNVRPEHPYSAINQEWAETVEIRVQQVQKCMPQ